MSENDLKIRRWIIALRMIGAAGTALFCALLAMTELRPEAVERAAQAFLKQQVEKEVRAVARVAGRFPEAAAALEKKYSGQRQTLKLAMKDDLPARIADEVARMCRLDCAGTDALREMAGSVIQSRIGELEHAQQQLGEWIQGSYLRTLNRLLADVRIFLICNAAAFLMLALLTHKKTARPRTVMVPATLLLMVSCAGGAMYLFGQDWFYTVLFGSYWGWGYGLSLGLVFAAGVDIAVNRGRVVDAAFASLGFLAPCA
ncbi:MAG: hypothetical protein OEY97_08790 [Nitrospirota bacterium]|nr:hypothetical protein [Nitrospirota bacterium]